jgi:hypothetical protein
MHGTQGGSVGNRHFQTRMAVRHGRLAAAPYAMAMDSGDGAGAPRRAWWKGSGVAVFALALSCLAACGQTPPAMQGVVECDEETLAFAEPGRVAAVAIALARERERGTIEALYVSPLRPWEIVVGKLLPGIVVGYAQMALILVLGTTLFGIDPLPVILPLGAIGGLFIAANLAIGLLISTASATQAQAMQLALLTLLPNVLLSGFMFPVAAMPAPAQWLSWCLPLTHFLRIDRALLLKHAPPGLLVGDIAALVGILVLLVAAASWRVRTRLG